MKRYVKCGSMTPEYIESASSLSDELNNKFYEWTGISFTVQPDSIKLYTVRNWLSSDPWFKMVIDYDVYSTGSDIIFIEMAGKYIDSSTPMLNDLLKDENIKLYYSDITIEDSDKRDRWYDGLGLDYGVFEDDNYDEKYGVEEFDKEVDEIGNKIVNILYSHKDDILNIILDYVVWDMWESEEY